MKSFSSWHDLFVLVYCSVPCLCRFSYSCLSNSLVWSNVSLWLFPVVMNPLVAFELLFFAVFGQTTYEEMMVRPPPNQQPYRPAWTENLFKVVFGIYMLVSVVVLINLLIAMMSDTYQRIQVRQVLFTFCFSSRKESHPGIWAPVLCRVRTNLNRSTENIWLQDSRE